MADIGTITQGASYRGDAALGGGFGTAIKIDDTPIQRLMQFTFLRDRDLWEQENKKNVGAAKEIADMTALDPTSSLTGYSGPLKAQLEELRTYVRENPDSLVYDKSPEKFIKRKELESKFHIARKSATTNDTIYNARKAWIDTLPKDKKELEEERLAIDVENLFGGGYEGAINNILASAPDIKQEDYKLPKTAINTIDVIKRDANGIEISKSKYIDVEKLEADAELKVAGIDREKLDVNSPEFKALPERVQKFRIKEYAYIGAERENLQKTATELNNLIAQKKVSDPKFTIEGVTGDIATGDTLLGIIKAGNIYNSQIEELSKATGKKYKKIDLNQVSPAELLIMQTFMENGNSIVSGPEIKYQETDDAIQRAHLSQGWAQIGIEQQKLNKDKMDDIVNANSVIQEVVDAIKAGTPVSVDNYGPRGETKTIREIADPNLLKEFATIDKDGKTTKTPDVIQYDPDKNQLSLVYYDKKKTASGKNVQNEVIPLNPTQWMGQITKRKFPNKDIGGVNTFIDQFYNKSGRTLTGMVDLFGGNKPAAQTPATTQPAGTLKTKKVVVKGL